MYENILNRKEFQEILPQGERWTEELRKFLAGLVATREQLRGSLRLPSEVGMDES